MNALSKLSVALVQPEIIQGCPLQTQRSIDTQVRDLSERGVQLAVLPLREEESHRETLIALNGAHLSGGSPVCVTAGRDKVYVRFGTAHEISVAEKDPSRYIDVLTDISHAYTIESSSQGSLDGHITLVPKFVGVCNHNKSVHCFNGGSIAYSDTGAPLLHLSCNFIADAGILVDEQTVLVQSSRLPAHTHTPDVLDALIYSVRAFDEQVLGASHPWIIGLSGGIDSSVVAAVLVCALGAERVKGYALQSRYNSDITHKNAEHIAHALHLSFTSGSIESLVEATHLTASAYGYADDDLNGLVAENVQARIRGHLLSTFAAIEGGVVVNNGNYVEAQLGYATLYGDAIGALAPLGDLSKEEVFSLARIINKRMESDVIPECLIPSLEPGNIHWDIKPSAELGKGQVDPMKWIYHDRLIRLLEGDSIRKAETVLDMYLHNTWPYPDMNLWIRYYGLDDASAFIADLEHVISLMHRATFKRIQSPPKICLHRASVVQESVEVQGLTESSERYYALRDRILDEKPLS